MRFGEAICCIHNSSNADFKYGDIDMLVQKYLQALHQKEKYHRLPEDPRFLQLFQPHFSTASCWHSVNIRGQVVSQEAAGPNAAHLLESEIGSRGGVAFRLFLQLRACYIPTRNSARTFAVQLVPCSHEVAEGVSIRPCTCSLQFPESNWSHIGSASSTTRAYL